jgi:hypothetical protein
MIFIHMTPVAGNTGRVADLALSFRAPGSQTRVTQRVSLNYADDPTATPEQPYLSSPEMAERFAMYNMFIGIRAATQATELGCAETVLEATRSGAAAWNTSHEDPDIAADVMLVDQYLANIAAYGPGRAATGPRPIAGCPTATGPDGPPLGVRTGVDEEPPAHYHELVCSSGSGAGGLPILFAAAAAVGARRRRRR